VSYLQMHNNKLENQESENPQKMLLSDHLIAFFKLYGYEFNYKEVGISVRKQGFYYKREIKNFDNWMSARAFLSLENPVNPNINVTKGAYNFHKIQQLFAACYKSLVNTERREEVSLLSGLLIKW
jgi:non-canonical poly(A) RNA polymerase PAPD5/7